MLTGVIRDDRFSRQDMAAYGVSEGFQQGGGLADPVDQGRSDEVEPVTVEDLALAVERQVIGKFACQSMGQETRAGAATFNGARGQRRLDEPFAAGAGQPEPHDALHEEASRDVFQLVCAILADAAQTAAIGASLGTGHQFTIGG